MRGNAVLMMAAGLLAMVAVGCSLPFSGGSHTESQGVVQFVFAGGTSKSAARSLVEDAAAVVLSIADSGYQSETIPLMLFGECFYSLPISLNPGAYELTEFVVIDAGGRALFAVPVGGSLKAMLVDAPLPIAFSIGVDELTEVVVEVLDVEEATPEEFGYSSFTFDVVDTFTFLLAVFDGLELIEPDLVKVVVETPAGEKTLYQSTLDDDFGAATNAITVTDGCVAYTVVVEEENSAGYEETFSADALKGYWNNPLIVTLEVVPPPTAPSAPAVYPGDAALNVEWSAVAEANGYEVWYNTSEDSSTATQSNGTVSDTSHTISGLINGMTYWAWVKALNAGGVSPFSPLASGTPQNGKPGGLDAFVANIGPNILYSNDGSNGFTGSPISASPFYSNDVALGDFNADGYLDVFEANESQPNRIYLNDGTGSFTVNLVNSQVTRTLGADVGDLNGDGHLDVYGACFGYPDRVYLGAGDGSFSVSVLDGLAEPSYDVELHDFDSDGDLDALVVSHGREPIVYLNDGSASFTPRRLNGPRYPSRGLALGDFTSDGITDALVVNRGSGDILYVGDGSGFFAPAQIISFSWPSFDAAAGDVNGDGNLDVIVAMDGYRDTVYFGNGAGSFEFAPVWPINPPNYNTRGIALADLDGDGDLDGFAANFGQPDQVYLNDGSGSFSILRAASFAYQSFGVALGQLDGK